MRKLAIFLLTITIMSLSSFSVFAANPVVQPSAGQLIASTSQEGTKSDLSSKEGVNVKDYGAKGDGINDDTSAIQAALDQNNHINIPDGTYLINVDTPLKPKSNQTIALSNNAVLKAIPTSTEYHSVIYIDDINNTSITGGKIIGERNEHKGTTGQWGMGINILNGANNIVISDITISDFWGDGIYLGGSPAVSEIKIDHVICDNNRRIGLCITNANKTTISNSSFKNSKGSSPEAGLDIEPNANEIAEDIKIMNTQFLGNNGSGIDLLGVSGIVQRIMVVNSITSDNLHSGIRLINASNLTFSDTTVTSNHYGVEISRNVTNVTFINMNISTNEYLGVSLVSSEQTDGIKNIVFENTSISNNSQSTPGQDDGIKIDSNDSTGYIKDVQFKNTQFFDDQMPPTQRYGMTVGSSETISGVTLDSDCIFTGNALDDIVADSSNVQRDWSIKNKLVNLFKRLTQVFNSK